MNKQELIGHVADRAGLNRNDAVRAVETMLEVIMSALKRGDEVLSRGAEISEPVEVDARTNMQGATKIPVAQFLRSRQRLFVLGFRNLDIALNDIELGQSRERSKLLYHQTLVLCTDQRGKKLLSRPL